MIYPSVTIATPDGQATLSNPLYAYTFLDTLENEGIPSDIQSDGGLPNPAETVRQWNSALQQSNQSAANAVLAAQAPTILSYVYNMLTVPMSYSTFAYLGSGSPGYDIEYIHNLIHNCVGGLGTMADLRVAAFDPIFYLHHANVDRLFAMWQALNPDSYITPTQNWPGSYYEPSGTWNSGNSSESAPLPTI